MSHILTLNGGSSSIRFAVFDSAATGATVRGKIERLDSASPQLHLGDAQRTLASDGRSGAEVLIDALGNEPWFAALQGVGHRIVHGMQHTHPERVTPALLKELRRIVPLDPEHLPRELELIERLQARHPGLAQVACFDTAFHRSMPRIAKLLPIPRRYLKAGLERYGFHGLSYTYLLAELERRAGRAAAHGRVILAHLGSGSSMAALRDGRCLDTSMAFTPAAGLVMATRSGDLDPGLIAYLISRERLSGAQLEHLVNHESGMLGVSGTSGDVRDLLAAERDDVRAAEALELFCYQAKKWLGAFCAVLGGLDTLVFAGGIGENAAAIRERICRGLGYLGIHLNAAANEAHSPLISSADAPVTVHIIRTDEESVIAALTEASLHPRSARGDSSHDNP